MTRVLVVSTSKKTRGGITAVLKLYEQSDMWRQYHCCWIGTHRDGSNVQKVWYYVRGFVQVLALLPFYDIVHFHISLQNTVRRKYPLFKIVRIFNKKTILHLHCGSQIDDIWSSIYQTMFEQCDCGILLSESIRDKIERHIGQSKKLRVIYNPCPVIKNTNKYDKRNCILFSGTLYEGKGYKDLIRAFAKIANRHTDWKVVLAGNGEMEQARTLAITNEIAEQVELLGWVDGEQKHRAYCEAEVFCLPSYAEGFPMAVLDAWAYSLPVITTPVGGIPDVAVDGENMLLFNPGDVDALSARLEMLINNVHLRRRLANESRKLSDEKFNLKSLTEEVARIYDSLIDNA